jgi:phosphopantothenoylcysteine decarboxylase / phosphopantothenate---cysteine ligase
MLYTLHNRRILLIISGGIAAYKSLDLIRRLRDVGATVRCVLTQNGAKFITPLSVSALSQEPVYTDLWSLTDEAQMGHIRLSREADLVVIAPASANLIGKMAQGLADDLASTILLATDKPVLIAPAMNIMMWQNLAVQANVKTLLQRGLSFIGPASGMMACGETGEGRMAEPAEILAAVGAHFSTPGPLTGKRALVTSGPTHEPLDPVRFIGNRSSGKQGYAIAEALREKGAETILVSGPTSLPDPAGIKIIRVQTANEMLAACENELPADIAVCAAAVADWRPAGIASEKLKKSSPRSSIDLIENPDILGTIAKAGRQRPRLVIGFAAETQDLLTHATDKLDVKNCDWLLANDVSDGKGFDHNDNEIVFLRRNDQEKITAVRWPYQSKTGIARTLVDEVISFFNQV